MIVNESVELGRRKGGVMINNDSSRHGSLIARVGLGLLMSVAVLASGLAVAQQQVDKLGAKRKALTVIEKIWDKADKRKGLRAQQHPLKLSKGSQVMSAFSAPGKEHAVLTCKHTCWFFFVDEDPNAHFAHPVHYILIDTVTGEEEVTKAEWWPLIDGKPRFSKLKERTDPATIIFDKTRGRSERGELRPLIGTSIAELKMHSPCCAWAIIVCGYDDLPDTFDEDTDGIYSVLTGLGVTDDHIFFVSPHTTHPGVDQPLSVANVQWAINQVASGATENDKVLFFYSSHGGIDSLTCGGNSISAATLSGWLNNIHAEELSIVMEACHSGSFIGKYKNGTYVAAEDDLTGNGELNRAVLTSASTDTSSYADVDGSDDPNPGDSGSETIWGYVEAFSTSAADTNGDSEISFGEAWQYAWKNDVTRIRGLNVPQMTHTGLNASNVYNYCYRVTGPRDLFVSDGPGDVGHNSYDYNSTDIWVTQDPAATEHRDVVSGMDNYVHVAVHNRGTTPITNGSLNVYWADTSTATSWPGDFHQIGSTDTFGSLAPGDTHIQTWTWPVNPSIGLGHHFCLVATADSPDDPIAAVPAGVTYVAPFDNNIGQKNITIVEDPGHGVGTFDFTLKNNTRDAEFVDLVAEWIGRPWGSVMLVLPEDLTVLVKKAQIQRDNLKAVDLADRRVGLEMGKEGSARLQNIPLKPGESRIVTVIMRTERTEPALRNEIRLSQEAKGKNLGVVTVRLQEVHPADCSWVGRASVEAFADLGFRHNIPEANEISRLFAKLVSGGCGSEKQTAEVLMQALSLQQELVKKFPPTHGDAHARFAQAVEELADTLKQRRIRGALGAQGRILEAAKELRP